MTVFVTTFPLHTVGPGIVPFRDFTVAVNETGAVLAAAFGDISAPPFSRYGSVLRKDATRCKHVLDQVKSYMTGELRLFELALEPEGSVFQKRVWAALAAIPFGQTRSYGDLAQELTTAPRAVGRANATNPICLIVPCHRVIGADGSLTGFAYGEPTKRWLLDHEESAKSRMPGLRVAL